MIRNIVGLARKSAEVNFEKEFALSTKKAELRNLISTIMNKKSDVIDALDTKDEMYRLKIPFDFKSPNRIVYSATGGLTIANGTAHVNEVSFTFNPQSIARDRQLDIVANNTCYFFPENLECDDCLVNTIYAHIGIIQAFAEDIDTFLDEFFKYINEL